MKRTATPLPFPPQTLADWCREDGHEGCAIWIEESPEWLLPTVLDVVARHIARNDHIRDEESMALPWILKDEAHARRSTRRGALTLSNTTSLIALGAVFLTAAYLEYVWA